MKPIVITAMAAMLVIFSFAPGQAQPVGPLAGGGFGPMRDFAQNPETQALRQEIQDKTRQLFALFGQPEFDEAAAKNLHQEVSRLRQELSDKRFEAALEFKKRNPDWQPRVTQPRPRRNPAGRNRPGWSQSDDDRPGWNQSGYNRTGWNRSGYNRPGWNNPVTDSAYEQPTEQP